MSLDHPISLKACELAEQLSKKEVMAAELTADRCEGFNPTEVRIVIREALRQRLADIGQPTDGVRYSYGRLQQLSDPEISRLQDLDIKLNARYSLKKEALLAEEEAV